jgi:multimeric flavodoxin WrbA
MPNILIVSNCPSANTTILQEAVVSGCENELFADVHTKALSPLEATAEDVLWCSGIIIGSTENFGYMSGQVKDFFERIYYPCLEVTEGKPTAIFIKGGLDGQGAKNSIEKILLGLKWKLVQPTLILKGDFNSHFVDQCNELGMTMAAGLDAGIF